MGWWIGANRLSTEQREIIAAVKKDLTKTHWIKGAAGTGKTTVLAELAQELRQEYPNVGFCFLTYTHALKDLAKYTFQEEKVTGVHFLTHTKFLHNNRPCSFVFLDEVQDIKAKDLLTIKKLAKHLIVAGDCTQAIYDSPSEQEIQNALLPAEYVLKLMHRLTESLAAIAKTILPHSNIVESNPANSVPNTEVRLVQCPDQKAEFIWVIKEALARARPDKPSCILFSHHQEVTVFYKTIAEYLNIKYTGNNLYNPNKPNHLNYYQVNMNFKSHQLNLCYLGNGFGSLEEVTTKPMVYLMIYHSAKGLDFNNVFIPQLNNNKQIVYPFILEKNIDLDKRLLFVAVTRSRCNLFLTYSTIKPYAEVQNLPNTVNVQSQPIQDNDDEDFF